MQVVSRQYGEQVSAGLIQNICWYEKLNLLKKNLVTVDRQTDYTFRQLWGKVTLGGMYPIGQILNHDERREFQNR